MEDIWSRQAGEKGFRGLAEVAGSISTRTNSSVVDRLTFPGGPCRFVHTRYTAAASTEKKDWGKGNLRTLVNGRSSSVIRRSLDDV